MSSSKSLSLNDDSSLSYDDDDAKTLTADTPPPSPGGSLKDVDVARRATPIRASTSDNGIELDISHFGLTPCSSPAGPLIFPMPPPLSSPPLVKNRRYASSLKSLYTGTGTGTSLRTNIAPVVPVQLVRRGTPPPSPAPAKPRRAFSSSLRALSGLFRRPTASAARPLSPTDFHNMPPMSPTLPRDMDTYPPPPPRSPTPPVPVRKRAMSIRSFRSTKSKGKGIENIAIPPVPARPLRPRVYSFSGYLSLPDSDSDPHADEAEEMDAEVRAIEREAYETVQKINENYVYVPGEEVGVAL